MAAPIFGTCIVLASLHIPAGDTTHAETGFKTCQELSCIMLVDELQQHPGVIPENTRWRRIARNHWCLGTELR